MTYAWWLDYLEDCAIKKCVVCKRLPNKIIAFVWIFLSFELKWVGFHSYNFLSCLKRQNLNIQVHVLQILLAKILVFHFLLTGVNAQACQYRGNKTDNGFINFCTSCMTTTDLGSERFPRYINEIVCNVEPCLTVNRSRKDKYYCKNGNLIDYFWNLVS